MKQQPAVFQRTIFIALWSLPVLFAAGMVWKHAVPVPFWDEWNTPGSQLASYYRGTLRFAELFSQHNESRKLFPRLIYLPISIVAGWDVRYFIVLTFAWACAGSAGLYRLVRQTSSSAAAPFAFAAMNLLLFSPRQYENLIYGIQGEPFTPGFALIFAILTNLSERSLKTKTLVNAAWALLSTYTFANGMLLWLLAFPLATAADLRTQRRRTRLFWRVLYVLMAAVSIACYFISYRHPTLSPPLVSPIAQFPAFLHFILVWIGSLFSAGQPAVWGAGVLLLFVALAIAALRQVRRTGVWRPHYPWLVLGCYTLISGCVTAAARLGFPWSMAGDARYTAFSVFLYLAVFGLGLSVWQGAQNRAFATRVAIPAFVVSLGLVLALWTVTFKKERRFLRDWTRLKNHSLLVLRWAEAIPQNPGIASLSPYPETPAVIHTLAEHDAIRPRLVSRKLAHMVAETPNPGSESAGLLEQTTPGPSGRVLLQGWARLPEQNRPADCVVLGFATADNSWQPFYVLETGTGKKEGFSQTIEASSLPRGAISIRACAIDLERERVFPMAGAIQLQRER